MSLAPWLQPICGTIAVLCAKQLHVHIAQTDHPWHHWQSFTSSIQAASLRPRNKTLPVSTDVAVSIVLVTHMFSLMFNLSSVTY